MAETARETTMVAGWKTTAVRVAVQEAASAADRTLGRARPDSRVGGSLLNVKLEALIPDAVAKDPRVKTTMSAVLAGQVGLAVINLLAQGTVTATLAAASTPTVGGVVDIYQAFTRTLLMSLSVSVWVYLIRTGKIVGAQAACASAVIIASLIFGPAMSEVMGSRALSASSQGLATLLDALCRFYGAVPFFGGLLTGGICGFLSYEWTGDAVCR